MLTKHNVQKSSILPILFVLLLFLVLSVLSCAIIASGNSVYRKIVDDMDANYQNRVALSYINTKVRQNDSEGLIKIEEFDGTDCLIITEFSDDIEYSTFVYFHEGYIKELFIAADEEFDASAGDRVVNVEEFTISKNQNTINVGVTNTHGKFSKLTIALRTY